MRDYAILDVFTSVPLAGNPLAVFADGRGLSDDLMQRAAREMNLSESVFLRDPDDGADARARIFTPAAELPFAGHPVLGTAFLLGAERGLDLVRVQTAGGVVPIALRREGGEVVHGEMEQPIPSSEPFPRADELLAALGVGRSELPVAGYRNGPLHVYVMLGDEASVASLAPDLEALRRLGELGVSCFAVSGSQVKTRMFAPALGVSEDPATGSAAGPLAVHLACHGVTPFEQQLEIHQGAEIGRPSLIYARADGAAERVTRVLVGGSAVVVARGRYRLR